MHPVRSRLPCPSCGQRSLAMAPGGQIRARPPRNCRQVARVRPRTGREHIGTVPAPGSAQEVTDMLTTEMFLTTIAPQTGVLLSVGAGAIATTVAFLTLAVAGILGTVQEA